MGSDEVRVKCERCGAELKESDKVCPKCGSTKKAFERKAFTTVGLRIVKFSARQKRKGFKKFMKEMVSRWLPSGSPELKQGVYEERIIDKEKDKYNQTIKDARTGEIIHEEHEPLSQHRPQPERVDKETDRNLAAEQPEGKAGESKGSAATGYKAIELNLIEINKKLSAIDGKVDENMKEGNRLTLGVVGFSVAMAGTMLWIQTKMRSPVSDFLIFIGISLLVLARLLPKLQGKASLKKITKIAFIVALAVLFIYAIVFIVIVT